MRVLSIVPARFATGSGVEAVRARSFVRSLAVVAAVDVLVVAEAETALDVGDLGATSVASIDRIGPVARRRLGPLWKLRQRRLPADAASFVRSQARAQLRRHVPDPGAVDVVWCADVLSLYLFGRVHRTLPVVLDVAELPAPHARCGDRFRALELTRYAAGASTLVTVPSWEAREELAVPGALVVAPDATGAIAERDLGAFLAAAELVVTQSHRRDAAPIGDGGP